MKTPIRLWGSAPPDRIFGWQDSQLSIARHYGGCTFRGVDYMIDEATEGNPLVKIDVLKQEKKARYQAERLAQSEDGAKQQDIFG